MVGVVAEEEVGPVVDAHGSAEVVVGEGVPVFGLEGFEPGDSFMAEADEGFGGLDGVLGGIVLGHGPLAFVDVFDR